MIVCLYGLRTNQHTRCSADENGRTDLRRRGTAYQA